MLLTRRRNQKKRIILSNVIKTNSVVGKTIGLLRSSKPQSLYLQTRFGIHTFGMRYPIDVIIVDNQFIVRVIKAEIKPNRIFLWNPQYQHVLELPVHTIRTKQIQIGQKIVLQ